MVTISSARKNKIKDSIIKEQLMESIINDLKINIEETQNKLNHWELQLIKLKEQERILFSDKFQVGDKVLYTNKGFFDKKLVLSHKSKNINWDRLEFMSFHRMTR